MVSPPGQPWAVQGGWSCARISAQRWGLQPGLPLLAGTLKLMEEADRLLWSVQVDHQLFALEKLDVTVSGTWGRGAASFSGATLPPQPSLSSS